MRERETQREREDDREELKNKHNGRGCTLSGRKSNNCHSHGWSCGVIMRIFVAYGWMD